MAEAVLVTGPGDVRDQRWLDERVASIEDGIEAVVDIARNWSDGRNLARLHPGLSAAGYITEHVGVLGKSVVPVLLAESNWSNRQIAAVAGVSYETVRRERVDTNVSPAPVLGADNKVYPPRVVPAVVIDEPVEEDQPIDTQPWRDLVQVMEQVEALANRDAALVAATVPKRRRAATAKRLRRLGTSLGSIAWSLEGEEYAR